jgi:hypothetical protein
LRLQLQTDFAKLNKLTARTLVMGTLAGSLIPQNLQTWESETDILGICPMAPARKISIGSARDPLVTGTNFSAVLSVVSALWYPNAIAGPRDHDLPARKGTPRSLRGPQGGCVGHPVVVVAMVGRTGISGALLRGTAPETSTLLTTADIRSGQLRAASRVRARDADIFLRA